jgi:uncharacterized protein (DUF305 family)
MVLWRMAFSLAAHSRHDTVGERKLPGAMGRLRLDSIGVNRRSRTRATTTATLCRWLSTVLFASLPATVAYGQQTQPSSAPVVVQPGAPGTPSRQLPSSTTAQAPQRSQADVEFMQGMIMHHGQAVEMTALIPSHTENKEIRSLGARIGLSQADEMKFMKRWLRARGEPISMAMPGMPDMDKSGNSMPAMPGMLTPKQMEALRQAKGAEFDQLFLTGMIQHHNGALVMVKQLFDTPGAGQDAELFDFATDADNTQRAEIGIMQDMLKEKR